MRWLTALAKVERVVPGHGAPIVPIRRIRELKSQAGSHPGSQSHDRAILGRLRVGRARLQGRAGWWDESGFSVLGYGGSLRTFWPPAAVSVLLGLAGGAVYNELATPEYASEVTFYVSTPLQTGASSSSADQFAQSRAQSYAQLLSTQRVARLVQSAGGGLTVNQIEAEIRGAVPVNSVLVTATVTDTSAARAVRIADSLSADFGPLVAGLDNGTRARTVKLDVVSAPGATARPVSPLRRVNLAVGVLVGAVAGLISVSLLDRLRATRHRSPRPAMTGRWEVTQPR